MANERENKLRCFENEAIKCESREQVFQVAKKLNELGERCRSGKSCLDLSNLTDLNSYCLVLTTDSQTEEISHRECGNKVITATEWLNRWHTTVIGQEVLVRDWEADKWINAFYIGIDAAAAFAYNTTEGDYKLMKYPTTMWNEEVQAREEVEKIIDQSHRVHKLEKENEDLKSRLQTSKDCIVAIGNIFVELRKDLDLK